MHAPRQSRESGDARKWMKMELVGRVGERTCGTSPSKVYANRERTTDFLLGKASVHLNAKFAEVGLELLVGAEDESSHAEPLRGFGIGRDIINEDGFLGADFACAKGFRVDERIGFVGADAKGINANRKEPEKGETRFGVWDRLVRYRSKTT